MSNLARWLVAGYVLELHAEPQTKDTQAAATTLGLQFNVLRANSQDGLDAAFLTVARQGTHALVISADPFFLNQRERLVALAARHATSCASLPPLGV